MKYKNKLKIYYSTVEFYPMRRVDISVLFFKELFNRGIECTWYTRNNGLHDSGSHFVSNQEVILPKTFYKNYFFSKSQVVVKLLNKLFYWGADIVNISHFVRNRKGVVQIRDKYIAALFAIIACKLSDKKFIYWLSYPFPEHKIELSKTSSGLKSNIFYLQGSIEKFFLYKVIIPASYHCFVQSERMKLDVANYGVAVDKLTPVPMGISNDLLNNNLTESVRKNQIIYLGTLSRVRKLDILIDIMSYISIKNKDISLLIVGEGESADDKILLENKVENLSLSDRVRFTGQLPFDQAIAHVTESYVGISPFYPSPALISASPTKIVEYMALGLPVVANNQPEQKLIIEKSGGGLVVDWSIEHFAEAILHLFENPSEATEMGKKGMEWVSKNRTYEVISEKVYDTYMQLLNKNNN